MELFIRIKDGQPFEHPILGDNFRQAFPNIDVNNLPPEYARFERVEKPNSAGTFEVEELSYQWVDGIVKDVWTVRQMTDEEHQEKLQYLTNAANSYVSGMKEFAQLNIDTSTNEENTQLWINYLFELNSWVLIDPVNPNFPILPRIKIVINKDNVNSSGSQPNVIG
jgi:hypothetical protein